MTLDAKILAALRSAPPGGISRTDLAGRLGVSAETLSARIDELRALGYEIDESPHTGCRLVGTPDVLHPDDLLSRLEGTRVVGRDIRVFQETGSTNDVADRLARDGAREGLVIFAESQTKGRGRLGRPWISPAGKGLWFSVIFRPDLSPQQATRFTICASTAAARAIRTQTGLRPEIKWPNDILVRGKKAGGILTELAAEVDRIKHLILGIGIDVNLDPADFPPDLLETATSLKIEAGHAVDRPGLAAALLLELDFDYHRVVTGRFEEIADEWASLCSTLGQNIAVQVGDRQVRGRAESLDSDGALLIRTEHGHVERIIGGDLTLEPSH